MTKRAHKAPDGDKDTATAKQEAEGTKGVSNQPENKMSDIKDNSVSADEMTHKRHGDTKGAKLAAQDADTAERIQKETQEEKREEDTSIHMRLARSGYVYNEDQISGDRWVGESVQRSTDPRRETAKLRTRVTSIAERPPYKGLRVEPIGGGEPFAIGDEFDKDAKVEMWFAVINPTTGKPFLEGV